ncbi:C-terminal binding protein [Marinomonas sp. S3726]|uniref:C-terminal binding protein n=1 Tax=Marinomonas sp. S3726 TaxID=579484 RepID=UPI000AD772CA|nr:C-terminal binding protein [Marinomonas sp. S3726]
MKLSKIVVLEPGYSSYKTELSILANLNVEMISVSMDSNVIEELRAIDPDIVFLRESNFKKNEIDACSNLKGIIRYGVGVDNIDLPYAKSKNIYVANVPDYGAEIEVSEHALALYLSIQRRISTRDREVREGVWGVGQNAIIPSRDKAILGLIGCGKIGLESAKKFRALGFSKVIAFDPYLSESVASKNDIEKVELPHLCSLSDVISLHAPLTEETHHILNKEMLDLMKPTTILINVSRGGLIDELALAKSLSENKIFGAGIDVFESEKTPIVSPLLSAPNTIVSDHTAWYSERSVEMLQRKAAECAYDILTGKEPNSWVNP